MNKQLAKENWRNFFRQMVGLPKIYPVKVKRSEEAKKYPLIQIKKHGDVGYDICATDTVVVPPSPVVAEIVVSVPSALFDTFTTVRGLPQLATSPIVKINEINLTIINQYVNQKGLYS